MEQVVKKTRAKFTCTGVNKRLEYYNGSTFVYDAEFMAVSSGSDENKSFWASSPGGSIKLSTIKGDTFEPGKSYYVDFTQAD